MTGFSVFICILFIGTFIWAWDDASKEHGAIAGYFAGLFGTGILSALGRLFLSSKDNPEYDTGIGIAFGLIVGGGILFVFIILIVSLKEPVLDPLLDRLDDRRRRKKKDTIRWSTVNASNTQNDYEAYLEASPKGRYRKQANNALESLMAVALEEAETTNTASSWQLFLSKWEDKCSQKQKNMVKSKLKVAWHLEEDKAWKEAAIAETALAMQEFLQAWPDGEHKQEAEHWRDAFLKQEATEKQQRMDEARRKTEAEETEYQQQRAKTALNSALLAMTQQAEWLAVSEQMRVISASNDIRSQLHQIESNPLITKDMLHEPITLQKINSLINIIRKNAGTDSDLVGACILAFHIEQTAPQIVKDMS